MFPASGGRSIRRYFGRSARIAKGIGLRHPPGPPIAADFFATAPYNP
jgi:hypothetical protein